MIDARERVYFERMKRLLEEQETLKADIAELKTEAEKAGGLTKERVGDLLAVAKLEVMDQVKRAAKDAQRKRRDELAGQLSILPEEPRRVRPTKVVEVSQAPDGKGISLRVEVAPAPEPEIPHDPETGEVIEEREAISRPGAASDFVAHIIDHPPSGGIRSPSDVYLAREAAE